MLAAATAISQAITYSTCPLHIVIVLIVACQTKCLVYLHITLYATVIQSYKPRLEIYAQKSKC